MFIEDELRKKDLTFKRALKKIIPTLVDILENGDDKPLHSTLLPFEDLIMPWFLKA